MGQHSLLFPLLKWIFCKEPHPTRGSTPSFPVGPVSFKGLISEVIPGVGLSQPETQNSGGHVLGSNRTLHSAPPTPAFRRFQAPGTFGCVGSKWSVLRTLPTLWGAPNLPGHRQPHPS